MNELLKKELLNSIGKRITIYTKRQGFRYSGMVLECDETFIKIRDLIKDKEKLIALDEISEMEIER